MRIRRVELASLAVALVLAGGGACRSGDAWEVVVDRLLANEEATLLPAGDREAYDRFGQSVALSADGGRALVAAPTDHNGDDLYAGSLHVFLRTGMTWTEEAVLFGGPGDHFGHSVAVSADGSRALVGANGDGAAVADNTGSALVLLRTGTTWTEEATLRASDGAPSDFFGQAVALSADGSWALVGVPGDGNSGGIRAGSVRVFQRTGATWAEQAAPLIASASVGQAIAVSADGSRALVGAPGADTAGGVRAGSAHVFQRTGTTWTEEATLLAADGAADDFFGQAVALSADGSRALVGASSDDTTLGANTGSARVFLRSGASWTEEATLLASGASDAGDLVGFAVTLSADGSRAFVGMLGDDTAGGVRTGSVRVFVRTDTSWTEDARLIATDGAASDYFGFAVAVSADGSRALVGASGHDTEAGRAHVFTLAPDASTGAAGAGGTGGATGTGGTGGATGTAGEGGTTGGTTGIAGSSGGGGGTGADAAAGDGGADDPKAGSGGCGCDCRVSSGAPATVPALLGIALALAARRRRRDPSP